MLHEAYGDDAWVKRQPTNGSDILKMEELKCMTVSGLADIQLHDPNLWLPKWKTSTEIVNQLREFAEEVGRSIGSCHMNLMEDLGMHQSQQNFCKDSWLMNRNCNDFPAVKISSKSVWWRKSLEKYYYQWQVVGLGLWRWNQTTVLTLNEFCFASPQESTTGELTLERNAAYFFIIEALCIMNSFLKARQ
jgi:hypothetical protein